MYKIQLHLHAVHREADATRARDLGVHPVECALLPGRPKRGACAIRPTRLRPATGPRRQQQHRRDEHKATEARLLWQRKRVVLASKQVPQPRHKRACGELGRRRRSLASRGASSESQVPHFWLPELQLEPLPRHHAARTEAVYRNFFGGRGSRRRAAWSRVFTTSSGVTSNVVASVPTDADRIRPSNDTWGWCGSVAGLKQDSSRWCRPRFIPGRGTTRPPSVATGRVAAQPYDPHAPRTRGNCEESITS